MSGIAAAFSAVWTAGFSTGCVVFFLFTARQLWMAGHTGLQAGELHIALWIASYGTVRAGYMLYRRLHPEGRARSTRLSSVP